VWAWYPPDATEGTHGWSCGAPRCNVCNSRHQLTILYWCFVSCIADERKCANRSATHLLFSRDLGAISLQNALRGALTI
jgi:hypothetical protein